MNKGLTIGVWLCVILLVLVVLMESRLVAMQYKNRDQINELIQAVKSNHSKPQTPATLPTTTPTP